MRARVGDTVPWQFGRNVRVSFAWTRATIDAIARSRIVAKTWKIWKMRKSEVQKVRGFASSSKHSQAGCRGFESRRPLLEKPNPVMGYSLSTAVTVSWLLRKGLYSFLYP